MRCFGRKSSIIGWSLFDDLPHGCLKSAPTPGAADAIWRMHATGRRIDRHLAAWQQRPPPDGKGDVAVTPLQRNNFDTQRRPTSVPSRSRCSEPYPADGTEPGPDSFIRQAARSPSRLGPDLVRDGSWAHPRLIMIGCPSACAYLRQRSSGRDRSKTGGSRNVFREFCSTRGLDRRPVVVGEGELDDSTA